MENTLYNDKILDAVSKGEEVLWLNPEIKPFESINELPLGMSDIKDAESRLERFAPLICALFPETKSENGIIESDLTEIEGMKNLLSEKYGVDFGEATLFLKRDSDLAVAGSVKARGGIYEVLKHSEDLAIENGLIPASGATKDDYVRLGGEEGKKLFSQYKMQVGSTGNLGMSIGIVSAALGYEAIVHMSQDAKEWKKEKLRSQGVKVIEYQGDYGAAVAQGRAESDADPNSYFVDDENSMDLFLGYAVAALRLKNQLEDANITIDKEHPLYVYIPCGVGGAPGGIAFGLKELYGDLVNVFFVEPTEAPCMLVGLASGKHNQVSVQDYGLSGITHADGLAVSVPSGFVGKIIEPMLSGEMTVEDKRLYEYLRDLRDSEGIFIEPSSCAGFQGPVSLIRFVNGLSEDTLDEISAGTHIVWATGGRLVPQDVRAKFYETYL